MPVHNRFFTDSQGQMLTPECVDRLTREGPIVPVAIALHPAVAMTLQNANLPVPSPVTGLALIDSGAGMCALDEDAVTSLGIAPFGTQSIMTPSGTAQQLTYPASLSFPGTPLPNVTFADSVGSPLKAQGILALIGRNVLRDFVFVYNGPGGFYTLSY